MEEQGRVCGICKIPKPLSEFYNSKKDLKFGKAWECKPCVKARTGAWQKENRQRSKNNHNNWKSSRPEVGRVWQGHKSRSDYHQQLVDQGGVCAICGNPETRKSKLGNIFSLVWDHDHTTNQFRGLLCNRCNRVLGLVNDDVELLVLMGKYIELWKKEKPYPDGDSNSNL